MEKNYFLVLDEDQVDKLSAAEVSFYPMEIGETLGVIVDGDHISKTLNVLEAEIEEEQETSYEGIIKVLLRSSEAQPEEIKHTVKVGGVWSGKNEEGFCKIAEEILVPAIKKDVVLHVPHSECADPEFDGNFHIWIWSTPSLNFKKTYPPDTMYGTSVDCRDRAFLPSGRGVAIFDDEGEWAVAELLKDNLYIHHDACNYGSQAELTIFRYLLQDVVIELTDPEGKEEKRKRIAANRLRRSREKYIEECLYWFEDTLDRKKRKIAEAQAEIMEYQSKIVKRMREVALFRQALDHLKILTEERQRTKFGADFDRLIKAPKVINVETERERIKIFTDTLYCVDPRTNLEHEIGKFRIDVYLYGENGCVRWNNLIRKIIGYDRRDMQAPHVFSDGTACLGNTEEVFPELIANYEFAALAMVAIQFIESVNVDDDAGRYIHRWPLSERAVLEIGEERRKEEAKREELKKRKCEYCQYHNECVNYCKLEVSEYCDNCGSLLPDDYILCRIDKEINKFCEKTCLDVFLESEWR